MSLLCYIVLRESLRWLAVLWKSLKLDQIQTKPWLGELVANGTKELSSCGQWVMGTQDDTVISRGDHNRSGCHCQLEREREREARRPELRDQEPGLSWAAEESDTISDDSCSLSLTALWVNKWDISLGAKIRCYVKVLSLRSLFSVVLAFGNIYLT